MPKRPGTDAKCAPFTLIEVVVAMGIMMVVAALVGSASVMFYNTYARSQRHSLRLQEYMAIDRIWDNSVRNMIPFRWTDSEGTERFIFEGKTDEMLCSTLRRAYGNDPGALMFLRIKLEEGQLVAEYSFYPRPQWIDADEGYEMTREVLAEKVSAISFQYAEAASSSDSEEELEWVEEWVEEEHAAIPLAVRLKVEWEDGTVEYWLRRVAGASGQSTFGLRETVSTETE